MSWDDLPEDPDQEWWDLQERLGRVDRLTRSLQLQLPGLVERRVPVRGITPGPMTGVGRLRLADSTTFLVGSVSGGDLSRIVRALHDRHAITLASWERTTEGLALTLAGGPGREPVRVWVLGPDQPD